jgi:hypothetical protein
MKNIIGSKLLSCWIICLLFLMFFAKAGFSQQTGKIFPGANEKSPSRSEYFTWINNTGEGSTEQQTLSNLDFFKWLHDEYGMVLDIYAFDAGNIDKKEYYGSGRKSKFNTNFPHGFGPIAEKAQETGTRLGIWDAPDRFGNTPEEEKQRIDYMVGLCRDYHFELFKIDGMGGDLRDEKQDAFIRMMTACRTYSPDLILLNHRISLGNEAVKHATTWLLGGDETYIDVHMSNTQTATHHRAGAMSREVVPDLKRLTEDHGVCISSCLDYWEDDLILQAFNRNLILAPQIYGSPWFLRDDEYPRLARIFNLSRKYKEILVNGIILPGEKYGEKAVSRGDDRTRLITLRNISWLPVLRTIKLDEEIGLGKGSVVELRQYHPVERVIGRFKKGETVNIEVLPFRSCLLMATTVKQQGPSIEGCDFEIVRDVAGKSLKINLLAFPGESKKVTVLGAGNLFKQASLDGNPMNQFLKRKPVEIAFPGTPLKEKYHRKLGDLKSVSVPDDAESLYEATCFAADNNALEARSFVRSGPTKIPQVQKARDAFFGHKIFIERGLWDRNLFDGNLNTSFYITRRRVDSPMQGGSFRLDIGKVTKLDSLKIILGDEQNLQPFKTWTSITLEVSADLKNWIIIPLLVFKEMVLPLDPSKPIRYLRFPGSPENVQEIEGYMNGKPVDRTLWRASNLFSPFRKVKAKAAFECNFVLNEVPKGSYLAVALNGRHGIEGAYAALRVNGKPVGAPDRSPSYIINEWERYVQKSESNYTYYFPLTEEMKGAKIDAVIMVLKDGIQEFKPEVWITAYPIPYEKKELVLY